MYKMRITKRNNLKKNQILELNTITKLKPSLEGFNIKVDQSEEKISKLEVRSSEIIWSEEQIIIITIIMKKKEDSLRDFGDTIKQLIYALWKLKEVKKKRKDQKAYLKK